MRVRIIMKPDRPVWLKKNVNEGITAFTYRAIRESDKRFGDMLHNQGYTLGYKSFRYFTYSRLMYKHTSIDKFLPDEKIEFQISSPIDDIIINFVKGAQRMGHIILYGHAIPLQEIARVKDDYKFNDGGLFKLISPAVMMVKSKAVEEAGMDKYIINNLIEKYYTLNKKMPKSLHMAIRLMNNTKCSIIYKESNYTGYTGTIAMNESPELIQMAYQAGIGSKNGQGCGMIETF